MSERVIHDNGEYMLTAIGKSFYVYRVLKREGKMVNLFGFRFTNLEKANACYTKCTA